MLKHRQCGKCGAIASVHTANAKHKIMCPYCYNPESMKDIDGLIALGRGIMEALADGFTVQLFPETETLTAGVVIDGQMDGFNSGVLAEDFGGMVEQLTKLAKKKRTAEKDG